MVNLLGDEDGDGEEAGVGRVVDYQGQNLAMTVLYVPYSLGSGRAMPADVHREACPGVKGRRVRYTPVNLWKMMS